MTKISPFLALVYFQMNGLRAPSVLPWMEAQCFYEISHSSLVSQNKIRRASGHFIITAHLDISPLPTFIKISSVCQRKACPHHETILHFNTSARKHVQRSNCVLPSNIPPALPTLNTAKFHLVHRQTLCSIRSSRNSEGSHGRAR
jgi:hypothetical protein